METRLTARVRCNFKCQLGKRLRKGGRARIDGCFPARHRPGAQQAVGPHLPSSGLAGNCHPSPSRPEDTPVTLTESGSSGLLADKKMGGGALGNGLVLLQLCVGLIFSLDVLPEVMQSH